MRHLLLTNLILLVVLGGCSTGVQEKGTTVTVGSLPKKDAGLPAVAPPVTSKKPATTRRPNHEGVVFVAEWHRIESGRNAMIRPPAAFRRDLERLHKLGFRPVTAGQYLSGKMDLAPGASPVVMTFDDAHPTQLRLKPDGTLDSTCAMGIWADFSKQHPDFPIRATFFVLPDTMWGQRDMLPRKLAMLKGWGCELANHTVTHRSLRSLSDAQVRGEIAGGTAALRDHGHEGPVSLALPMGISPRNRKLLATTGLSGTFLVGADPAPAPGPKLQRVITKIPRIQAYDGELSLDHWLTQMERGRVRVYVE